MTFDTLTAAKNLEAAGMENGQAEAVAKVVRDATADLVTRADLDAFEGRFDDRFVALEGRFDAKLANAINRILLCNLAVTGLLFAALKFWQ